MSNIISQMQILISASTKGLNANLNDATKQLNKFEKAALSVGKTLNTFIGVGVVLSIGDEIIKVTAEFQKFEAILTNTLGSNSAAKKALDDIRVFAKETPFEVSEVSAAYVRWANQGLSPTIDRMTKLGDVASSLGAGFEQTAEAFKDLAVGQTKRIEEIGISAQQANGKIQLSFKGVNLEIEKNAAGVQKALDTYSQLQGVQGTAITVSKTLGGQIEILKGSFEELFLTVGEGSGGGMADFILILQGIVDISTKVVKAINDQTTAAGKYVTEFLRLPKLGLSLLMAAFGISTEETTKKIEKQAETVGKVDTAVKAEVTSLDSLQLKLSQLNKDFEATDENDKKKLANIRDQIFATQAHIVVLENLRKQQEKNQKLTDFARRQEEIAGNGKLDQFGGKTQINTEQFNRTVDSSGTSAFSVPPITDEQISEYISALQQMTDAKVAAGVAAIESTDQQILAQDMIIEKQQQAAAVAQQVGSVIGDAFGDAVSGQKSALQATKQVVAKLLPLFLSMALAGTIAGAGKTTAPPPVIVALAAAGVAAVSALFKSATGHSGGGGGGAGMSQKSTTNVQQLGNTRGFGESGQLGQVEFVISGNNLKGVLDTQVKRNQRLG